MPVRNISQMASEDVWCCEEGKLTIPRRPTGTAKTKTRSTKKKGSYVFEGNTTMAVMFFAEGSVFPRVMRAQ
jgi:hypothetical protein